MIVEGKARGRWCGFIAFMELVVDGYRDLIVTATDENDPSHLLGHLSVAFGKAGTHETPMIQRVYVDPDSRRIGIGSSMMRFVIERLGSHYGGIVSLVVAADNHEVIPFYQRLGFHPVYFYPDGSALLSRFYLPPQKA